MSGLPRRPQLCNIRVVQKFDAAACTIELLAEMNALAVFEGRYRPTDMRRLRG